jgi:hypothetical protein
VIIESRLRNIALPTVFLMASTGLLSTPVEAATPLETKTLTSWFCSSLNGPVDFTKLAKSFPFDQLGEVTTTRKPIPKTGKESESTSTSVEQSATSKNFQVFYRYQYSNDEATAPFGFHIQVWQIGLDPQVDPTAFPKAWLDSLGKEEYQNISPIVGFGEKDQYIGYVSYFSYFPGTGLMSMHWFRSTDISKFSSVCKGR